MFNTFKRKATVVLTLLLSILLLHPIGVSAATASSDVELQQEYANSFNFYLNQSNSNFLIRITVTADTGSTFKNGIVSFRKLDGDDAGLIQTWLKLSSDIKYFSFTDNSIPYAPGTYRITFSATIVNNGYSEMVREYCDFTI